LEVSEQLLRQGDLLLEMSSNKQLPLSSFAGQFLEGLSAALAQQPELGSVIRCVRGAAAVCQCS
jgi:hypothetical protein